MYKDTIKNHLVLGGKDNLRLTTTHLHIYLTKTRPQWKSYG